VIPEGAKKEEMVVERRRIGVKKME